MPRYRKGSLEAKLYQGFKQAAKGDKPEKEAHFYRAEDGTVKRWKPAERSNSARSRAHRLETALPLQTRLALEVQRDNSNAYLRKLITLIQREADDPQIVRKLCEMVLSDLDRQ
jgi:hypothetical protein